MAGDELKLTELPLRQRKQLDCVETYLPKSIEFLSELYKFLRERIRNRLAPIVLDGFSIYEVDGVFRGEQEWEQRTLVIRLLLIRQQGSWVPPLSELIWDLGREIATKVALKEEQIWICHYPQTLTVFTGLKRLLS